MKIGDSVRLTKDCSRAIGPRGAELIGARNGIIIKKGALGHIVEIHKEVKAKPWFMRLISLVPTDYGVPEFFSVEFAVNDYIAITVSCYAEYLANQNLR